MGSVTHYLTDVNSVPAVACACVCHCSIRMFASDREADSALLMQPEHKRDA